MGMHSEAEKPDISGLPVYKSSRIFVERVDDEIHIIHGHVLFEQTIWTHVEIWNAADLIVEASACQQIALRPTKQLVRMSS